MKRRKFMQSLAAFSLLALAGGGVGYAALHHHLAGRNQARRLLQFASLDEALTEIGRLRKAAKIVPPTGEWTLCQHFAHCTQSINFSMQGFPEVKSPLFHATLGTLAFSQFERQGYMRHNRTEPIPAAPPLTTDCSLVHTLDELEQAVLRFDAYSGDLAPHFAYGKLSKNRYAKAHAFHLADHFAAMDYERT